MKGVLFDFENLRNQSAFFLGFYKENVKFHAFLVCFAADFTVFIVIGFRYGSRTVARGEIVG